MRKLTITYIDDPLSPTHLLKCRELFHWKSYHSLESLLLDKNKLPTDLYFLQNQFTSIGQVRTLEFLHFFSPHSGIYLFTGDGVQEFLPTEKKTFLGPTQELTTLKSVLGYLKIRSNDHQTPGSGRKIRSDFDSSKVLVRLNGKIILLKQEDLRILEELRNLKEWDLIAETADKKSSLTIMKLFLKLRSLGIVLEFDEAQGVVFDLAIADTRGSPSADLNPSR